MGNKTGKNILLELGEVLQYKNGQSKTISPADSYIYDGKDYLFGILFFSNIIPFNSKIINSLSNTLSIKEINEHLKLIICICDDNETEFSKILSQFSKINCFVIPFKSETIQKLINKYNIFTLPTLIIIDKNGKTIDVLKIENINNLNLNNIEGWKNIYEIKKIYGNKKYNIGDQGFINCHSHMLIYADYLLKSFDYGKGNWYCDICRKTNTYDVTNFYCDLCGYDVCDSCYEKHKKQ